MEKENVIKNAVDIDTILVNLDDRLGDIYLIREGKEEEELNELLNEGEDINEYNIIPLSEYAEDYEDDEEMSFENDNDDNFICLPCKYIEKELIGTEWSNKNEMLEELSKFAENNNISEWGNEGRKAAAQGMQIFFLAWGIICFV